MKKILILNGQYLPGYKGGGPIRSVQNMIENLKNQFEFYVLTSDRDFKENKPYNNIKTNIWIDMDGYKVFYLSLEKQNLKEFRKVINSINYDVIYLNGFFSPIFTIKPLILRKLGLLKNNKVIICARGDFSKGHLNIKKLKKLTYISLIKLIGLYKNVIWHATSKLEIEDLKDIFKNLKYVYAPNLSSISSGKINNFEEFKINTVKLVFISRICEKKNLVFALEILNNISNNINVEFDIYGPKENNEYWNKCEKLINKLPSNVKTNYLGELTPDKIISTFRKYDAFLFPTFGENYGHAIVEAIGSGCIPIISDQTPWRNLEKEKIGFDISLNNKNKFKFAIERIASMSYEERILYKNKNIDFYNSNIVNKDDIELNKKMFMELM
ncbi:MAG: glycosyltransferase family 4 protein [Clostridium perfringens]|nr:glycosyltransferase family 4 protein [Clostridium perfringens]